MAADPRHPKPLLDSVVEILLQQGPTLFNPSSLHQLGQTTRRKLDTATRETKHYLGVSSDWLLIWTSGVEEADHLLMQGLELPSSSDTEQISIGVDQALLEQWQHREHPHPSLLRSTRATHPLGIDPITQRWIYKTNSQPPDTLPLWLITHQHPIDPSHDPVSIATEQTRALQPRPWLHFSGATYCLSPKKPFASLGLDSLSLSTECIGGPSGVGCLLLPPGTTLAPLWGGGSQQRGMRPGTEPVGLALAMAEALRVWTESAL